MNLLFFYSDCYILKKRVIYNIYPEPKTGYLNPMVQTSYPLPVPKAPHAVPKTNLPVPKTCYP